VGSTPAGDGASAINRPRLRAALLLGSIALGGGDRLYPHTGKAPRGDVRPAFRVRVYNYEGVLEVTLSAAEKIADRVLLGAGLHAIWQDCTIGSANRDSSGCDMHPTKIDLTLYLVSRLEEHAPQVHRTALGYSLIPDDGEPATMAYVCYARVGRVRSGFRPEELLGLAMAHEIGHLLLGTNSHANYGLMRAPWTPKDLAAGRWEQFRFTTQQAGQLRAAIRGRESKEQEASRVGAK
jgi:hypothetical protein